MYFFVVFGMLVAFVDWRPIAVSALLTAVHHLILSALYPAAVFPASDLARVGLHVTIVLADAIVLFWIVRQMKVLFKHSLVSLRTAREALDDAELLRSVVLNVNDAVIVIESRRDQKGGLAAHRRVIYANEAFARMTKYAAADVIGGSLEILRGERTDTAAIVACYEAVMQTGSGSLTSVWYGRDGHEIEIEASMVGIESAEPEVLRTFAVVRDVTETRHVREALLRAKIAEETNSTLVREIGDRQRAEKRLAFTAYHDDLTGLPNRVHFRECVNEALAACAGATSEPAVFFVDLDRFKLVNDGLGHHSGDRLLFAVAERLKACLRENDTLARLGGDEFAVLISSPTDVQELDAIALRMLASFAAPFEVAGAELFASASIGIAHGRCSQHENADDMIRNADLAMYRAKTLGRGRHEHFVPALLENSTRLLQLDTQLRRALERSEITAFFQPIVKLSNRRLCGFEALARWRHPVVGLIEPGEFIALAEATGLIVELGQFVLEEACVQLRRWLDTYPNYPDLWVSVNVSPLQLRDPGYLESVSRTLERHAFPPQHLHLEITESTIVSDFEKIAPLLTEIRKSGVRISVDDFGTGFSSLQYLDQLPVDTLKIDRSFVSGRGEGIANLKIVRTIVNLARELELELVSEGIETEAQADMLRTLTRGYGQGYLYSRPLDASEATIFFEVARAARALA